MHIGIFDSGRGGRFVAEKLHTLLPHHDYTVIDDATHAPYGERTDDDIRHLTHAAIIPLLDCDMIVIACNTATAAAITSLREAYPKQIFVGFEPMIKPAAQRSSNRHVTLLATRATSQSSRTAGLIAAYGSRLTIDTPDTANWATMIDRGDVASIDLGDVGESVASGSDTIIIGCTHYIALMPRLRELHPHAQLLEPTEAIAHRISQLTPQPPR